jgi:hypothetical protein
LGRDDAVALTMGGFALALVMGEVEDGAALIDRALILNPNLALGWHLSGLVNGWLGKPDVEIERATHALRLSPLDPFTFFAFATIGVGHSLAGRYGLFVGGEGTAAGKLRWRGAHRCGEPCPRRAA